MGAAECGAAEVDAESSDDELMGLTLDGGEP
jgi:hypothetical protein